MKDDAALSFALFDTTVGRCGLAWGDLGIVGATLPEPNEAATRTRMRRRFAGATEAEPPADVHAVIRRIQGLLQAVPDDLAGYHVGSWSSKAQGESTQGSRNSHWSDNITFPSVVGCSTCLQPSLDNLPLFTGIVYTRS